MQETGLCLSVAWLVHGGRRDRPTTYVSVAIVEVGRDLP